jgi:hypothetical protein
MAAILSKITSVAKELSTPGKMAGIQLGFYINNDFLMGCTVIIAHIIGLVSATTSIQPPSH